MLGRKGKALELACGRGRNALYLASLGYDVIAADCALNGLKSCQASSEHLALSVYPVACDLKSYRFPQKCFDLVSVVRFLHRPLFTELINWLRPGGLLFYKTFSKSFLSINPGFNPDYLVEPGELLASDLDFGEFAEDPKTGTSFILARKTAPGG